MCAGAQTNGSTTSLQLDEEEAVSRRFRYICMLDTRQAGLPIISRLDRRSPHALACRTVCSFAFSPPLLSGSVSHTPYHLNL